MHGVGTILKDDIPSGVSSVSLSLDTASKLDTSNIVVIEIPYFGALISRIVCWGNNHNIIVSVLFSVG